MRFMICFLKLLVDFRKIFVPLKLRRFFFNYNKLKSIMFNFFNLNSFNLNEKLVGIRIDVNSHLVLGKAIVDERVKKSIETINAVKKKRCKNSNFGPSWEIWEERLCKFKITL